jgi:hypothetical protein
MSCSIKSLYLSDSVEYDEFLHTIQIANPSQIFGMKHISQGDRLSLRVTALART